MVVVIRWIFYAYFSKCRAANGSAEPLGFGCPLCAIEVEFQISISEIPDRLIDALHTISDSNILRCSVRPH